MNVKLQRYYNNLCTKVKNDIALTRDKYYFTELEKGSGNIKREWSAVNKILNKPSKANTITELDIDGKTIINNFDIANQFNNYFVKCARNSMPLATNKLCSCKDDDLLISETCQPNSFYFDPFTA